MDPSSTTPADNPDENLDPSNAGTDNNEPADTGSDNLDPSKSTEPSADGDKTPPADNKTDDTPATKFDDDLDDWISKRKLTPPSNDDERQALQDLRNEQREFTKSRQAAKEQENAKDLNKEIDKLKTEVEPPKSDDDDDEDDPELADFKKRLQAVEAERDSEKTTRLQSEFYTSNKVSDEEHKAIMEIFQEKVGRPTTDDGKRRAFLIWSSPDALPDLLDLAKARLAKTTDTTAAEEAAAKAERERIAKESQANPSPRGAKAPSKGPKSVEEQRLERFSKWD